MIKTENKLLIYNLVVKNGKLAFKHKSDLEVFQKLASHLREGQQIQQMTNFSHDNGTLEQLAKIHASIAEIAKESGETKANVKKQVKIDCDILKMDGELISFADCSAEQLSDVIIHIIEIGEFLNLNLK